MKDVVESLATVAVLLIGIALIASLHQLGYGRGYDDGVAECRVLTNQPDHQ